MTLSNELVIPSRAGTLSFDKHISGTGSSGKGSVNGKGSPIKRSSVKGNTSPGQENHRFLAEVQRLCCVQTPSEPFLRLCRDVSRMVSGDLRCRSLPHLSPIRIKASTPLGVGPLPHLADQKIFGSMPCPRVFSQISWL
jgi:hypothetical protein